MYDVLRKFARRDDVANFIDDHLNYLPAEDPVRGIHVGIDRFWLECWITEWFERRNPYPWPFPRLSLGTFRSFSYPITPDLDFRPRDWNRHCRNRGYPEGANPIYIKFILRNPEFELKEPLRRDWQGYPLVYEYRPPCRALSVISWGLGIGQIHPGSSIGLAAPALAGTAGGFLRDLNTNKDYVVSCAHVLRNSGHAVFHPSPNDLGSPLRIGTVSFSLFPSPKGSKCNRVSAPNAPTLDLAIAELQSRVPLDPAIPRIGPVDHVSTISNMNPGDPVSFVGKKSGLVDAELGPLSIWHEIEIDGAPYCFRDLFTMTHRKPYYLNTNLASGGDSGAWIVHTANNLVAWDGMLIGGDGAQAYGCFAENIMDELDQNYASKLTLIP